MQRQKAISMEKKGNGISPWTHEGAGRILNQDFEKGGERQPACCGQTPPSAFTERENYSSAAGTPCGHCAESVAPKGEKNDEQLWKTLNVFGSP